MFEAEVPLCPAPDDLAVAKSATSVHEEPSQLSVAAVLGGVIVPAKAYAAVLDPAPDTSVLPVFKSLTSVHDEPFHTSVSDL